MNAAIQITSDTLVPTEPGTPFEGGFYVGKFRIGDEHFALIIAPKDVGEPANDLAWGKYGTEISGADSFNDGRANTEAMLAAELPLATWIKGLVINGFSDWYIPSRDELELIYRHLKPVEGENYTYRNGENPSALPPTHAYTLALPGQTHSAEFKDGGSQAMEERWYWSSTQYSAHTAWGQSFDVGSQVSVGKDGEGRARAVRRFKLSA
ncbi:DUF1566 domain-containing protein [Roseateles sp. UC29_93]|uniref:Lcl domain-containing protein n=1 Tax=Roseateles sp. UC29_93 TaxID=3350177 RepID=UPI0036727D3F